MQTHALKLAGSQPGDAEAQFRLSWAAYCFVGAALAHLIAGVMTVLGQDAVVTYYQRVHADHSVNQAAEVAKDFLGFLLFYHLGFLCVYARLASVVRDRRLWVARSALLMSAIAAIGSAHSLAAVTPATWAFATFDAIATLLAIVATLLLWVHPANELPFDAVSARS
jgi:hypothetical protein